MKTSEGDLLNLLLKYHSSGARYSCYPSQKFWTTPVSQEAWYKSVIDNYCEGQGVDLYIHIPFCNSVCSFCGCNIKITKDSKQHQQYIDAVKLQWQLYKQFIPNIKISSIYIGGGTPNALSSNLLENLLDNFAPHFMNNFTGTIEVDPRINGFQFFKTASNYQFSKIIIGVQDFNPTITGNVNRHQSLEDISSTITTARNFRINEICLELIFGLPLQTKENVQNPLRVGLQQLNPEQLILYPLAKAPWQEKTQQVLGDFTLPPLEKKYEIMTSCDQIIKEHGLCHIGANCYISKDSSLSKHKKFRDITGFKTSKSKQLIGLGNSAISFSGDTYIQNNKIVDGYIANMSKNSDQFISHSHQLNINEKKFKSIFDELIVNGKIKSNLMPKGPNSMFINNGILDIRDDEIVVTNLGKYFLKSICQDIDPLV